MKPIYIILVIFLLISMYILFSISLINDKLTCHYKHITYKNMLSWEIDGFYKIFNTSIAKYNSKYILCGRYSNKITKNMLTLINGCIYYKSHICFVILTNNMKIKKIIFPCLQHQFLEDPRIFIYKKLILVSITEFNSQKNIYPALYIFNRKFSLVKRIDYDRNTYHSNFPIQKNWCIFSRGEELLIHTDSFPKWYVYGLNHNNGNLTPKITFDSKDFFRDCDEEIIRCSTSWKSFDNNTFICGLHTKSFYIKGITDTMRTILVLIDKETLIPIKKTKPFCIDRHTHTRIQFLSGLETDNDNVYLSFGIGNYKTEIKRIPKYYILSLMC